MNRPIFTRSRCSLPPITRPFLLTTAFVALPLGWAKYSTRPLDADGLKSKFLYFLLAPDGRMWKMAIMSTATETMQPSARGSRGFLPRACRRLDVGGLKSKFLFLRVF